MALPRRNRLNLRFNRQTLNKEGVTHRTPLFTFITTPNSTPHSRFAVILSRKFSPLAVNRNRIKRLITDTLRLHLDKLPASQDILIIPQKKILSLSPDKLSSELLNQLYKFKSTYENKKPSQKNS